MIEEPKRMESAQPVKPQRRKRFRRIFRAMGVICLVLVVGLVAINYPSRPGPLPQAFPYLAREPALMRVPLMQMMALPELIEPAPPFQMDLRWRDVSRLDLTSAANKLARADFETATRWPDASKLPAGFDPQRIMELGKDPGLGIRTLHARGITGKGVGIAVIDKPLPVHHREYADRLRLYEEVGLSFAAREFSTTSTANMHGAATASVAVGKTCGVAPEADL